MLTCVVLEGGVDVWFDLFGVMIFIGLYFTRSACASRPDVIHTKREEVVCQLAVRGVDAPVTAEQCYLNIPNPPNTEVKCGA